MTKKSYLIDIFKFAVRSLTITDIDADKVILQISMGDIDTWIEDESLKKYPAVIQLLKDNRERINKLIDESESASCVIDF